MSPRNRAIPATVFKLPSDICDQSGDRFQKSFRPRMSFVQIQCSRCKTVFRDRAGRLQDGYSRQCPSCEVVLFFTEDSPNPSIKLAMRRARKARKEQRELEAERRFGPASRARLSRSFAGRTEDSSGEE
jgi:hypothetical protein